MLPEGMFTCISQSMFCKPLVLNTGYNKDGNNCSVKAFFPWLNKFERFWECGDTASFLPLPIWNYLTLLSQVSVEPEGLGDGGGGVRHCWVLLLNSGPGLAWIREHFVSTLKAMAPLILVKSWRNLHLSFRWVSPSLTVLRSGESCTYPAIQGRWPGNSAGLVPWFFITCLWFWKSFAYHCPLCFLNSKIQEAIEKDSSPGERVQPPKRESTS